MKERYESLDEYITDLQAEIAVNEDCANHYYNLGVALLSKKDYVASEEAFLTAVRKSPRLAEAYVQLGGLCLHRNDLEGCLRYNQEASQIRAKFSVPQANIGFVYLQMGELNKAIKALTKALDWDPEFVQARVTMASACFMEGKYDECIEHSNIVLKKVPQFAPAWNNLALALFEKEKYTDAMDAAHKADEFGYPVDPKFMKELLEKVG